MNMPLNLIIEEIRKRGKRVVDGYRENDKSPTGFEFELGSKDANTVFEYWHPLFPSVVRDDQRVSKAKQVSRRDQLALFCKGWDIKAEDVGGIVEKLEEVVGTSEAFATVYKLDYEVADNKYDIYGAYSLFKGVFNRELVKAMVKIFKEEGLSDANIQLFSEEASRFLDSGSSDRIGLRKRTMVYFLLCALVGPGLYAQYFPVRNESLLPGDTPGLSQRYLASDASPEPIRSLILHEVRFKPHSLCDYDLVGARRYQFAIDSESVKIGRAVPSDNRSVPIPDTSPYFDGVSLAVSRHHADISYVGNGAWKVEDRGSTNGTMIVYRDAGKAPVVMNGPGMGGGSAEAYVEVGDIIALAPRYDDKEACFYPDSIEGMAFLVYSE